MLAMRRFFDAAVSTILIWMLIVLLAIMTVQIVLRYGFSSSFIWAEEVCRYLLVWVSFLAAMLAYERGEIPSVPMLRDALPRKAGLALAMLVNALGMFLLCVLVWYGFVYAGRLGSSPIPAMNFLLGDLLGAGFPVPAMYWVYISLPIGLALFALRLAADIVLYARMLATGGHAADLRYAGELQVHG